MRYTKPPVKKLKRINGHTGKLCDFPSSKTRIPKTIGHTPNRLKTEKINGLTDLNSVEYILRIRSKLLEIPDGAKIKK